jgi:epoxyqueuosine reductase QueG
MEESMNDVLNDIADILTREGVSVWGMGPSEPMEGERPGYRPSDLVPGARSLVCFGIPVPRGIFDQKRHVVESNWMTQNLNYRKLDSLSVRLAARLEEEGERAVPVFGCLPMELRGLAWARGSLSVSVAGYLNQIRMGETTRIGTRGRNGALFHPRYGSRLMLGGVVTTAVLLSRVEPGLVETGCPQGCRRCVDACPIRAIRPEEKTVDIPACIGYTSRTPLVPKLRFFLLSLFSREKADRLMNQTGFYELSLHVCSRCVFACPD